MLLVGLAVQPAGKPVVECALTGDPAARVYQLIDAGAAQQPRWLLRLSAPALGQRRVDLPLANAKVEPRDGGLSVASVSANGGATVQIDAASGSLPSTVDVFVNFELEVNVWRDLSPDVEQMNTHGLPASAQCHVLSSPEPMPYHP
jgi:hypothetical protein